MLIFIVNELSALVAVVSEMVKFSYGGVGPPMDKEWVIV
jgi:hypothetical protein